MAADAQPIDACFTPYRHGAFDETWRAAFTDIPDNAKAAFRTEILQVGPNRVQAVAKATAIVGDQNGVLTPEQTKKKKIWEAIATALSVKALTNLALKEQEEKGVTGLVKAMKAQKDLRLMAAMQGKFDAPTIEDFITMGSEGDLLSISRSMHKISQELVGMLIIKAMEGRADQYMADGATRCMFDLNQKNGFSGTQRYCRPDSPLQVLFSLLTVNKTKAVTNYPEIIELCLKKEADSIAEINALAHEETTKALIMATDCLKKYLDLTEVGITLSLSAICDDTKKIRAVLTALHQWARSKGSTSVGDFTEANKCDMMGAECYEEMVDVVYNKIKFRDYRNRNNNNNNGNNNNGSGLSFLGKRPRPNDMRGDGNKNKKLKLGKGALALFKEGGPYFKWCRFGDDCSRKGCSFRHPKDPKK